MTWLPLEKSSTSERDSVLGLHAAAHAAQEAYLEACAAAFDAGLLDLCRARMALYLHCREELGRHDAARLEQLRHWDRASGFTPLQRAALAFVDQFILDPALIDRELVASLEGELGTSGVIDFAAVIAAFEASLRLSTLLDLEPAP